MFKEDTMKYLLKMLGLMLLIIFVALGLVFLGDALLGKKGEAPEVALPNPHPQYLVDWVLAKSAHISSQTAKSIVKEAMATDKPLLVLAIIPVESEFVSSAVSKKGAIGLMQVMFDVHKDMLIKRGIIKDKRDLFDIEPNIQAGNAILDMYLGECKGDVASALERYLGGKDGEYLRRILSNLANLYLLTGNN